MNNNEPWLETFSGGKFYPLAPHAEDVKLVDIAHALAMKCRFAGHCRSYYSVGQHCVLGAEQAERDGDLDLARAFLLHDAAEAYLFDCPKPIKGRVNLWKLERPSPDRSGAAVDYPMRVVENDLVVTVMNALWIGWPEKEWSDDKIKLLDARMLATEARDLMPSRGEGWAQMAEPFEWRISTHYELEGIPCWGPTPRAVESFLVVARRLGLRESA